MKITESIEIRVSIEYTFDTELSTPSQAELEALYLACNPNMTSISEGTQLTFAKFTHRDNDITLGTPHIFKP